MKMITLAVALAMSCGAVGSAHAAVTFKLDNVAFADGATVDGTFTTDDAISLVTGYLIETAASIDGSSPATAYAPSDEHGYGVLVEGWDDEKGAVPKRMLVFTKGGSILYLGLDRSLTNADANVLGGIENLTGGTSRRLAFATGAIVVDRSGAPAVPEPATWAMMLVGFGMVASATRFRRNPFRAAQA